MGRPRLRLVLEIDPTADPVAGTLREDSGPVQRFTGWTQLGHALAVVIAIGARAEAPGTGSTHATAPEETP